MLSMLRPLYAGLLACSLGSPLLAQQEIAPVTGGGEKVQPRFSLRQETGEGIGYKRGFSSAEAFVPLFQNCQDSVLFGNLRALNFNDLDEWEGQIGGGYRKFLAERNTVVGINSFYDARDTGTTVFHQLGLGVELLGERLEFRANGYAIIGQDRNNLFSGTVNQAVVGPNTVLTNLAVTEVALDGVDAEVGGRLPYMERFDVRAYVGGYHFSTQGSQAANGIRGRVEAKITDWLTAHAAVNNDALYDTTVTGGLAIHFGPRSCKDRSPKGCNDPTERLGHRVVRFPNVVIDKQFNATQRMIVNPPPPPPPPVVD